MDGENPSTSAAYEWWHKFVYLMIEWVRLLCYCGAKQNFTTCHPRHIVTCTEIKWIPFVESVVDGTQKEPREITGITV